MNRHPDTIPLDKCKARYLYRIRARNFDLGVYDGNEGFIGIRTKFGSRYLFTEYHWDQGPPYGTVCPLREHQSCLPEGIELTESLGSFDENTGRPVAFDRPIAKGGRGWYFTDTDEASQEIRAYRAGNPALFKWLGNQDLVQSLEQD